MNLNREINCFIGSVAGAQSSQHISLRCDSKTGPPALDGFLFDIFPEVAFPRLDLLNLRILFYLLQDPLHLLELQIDEVIHDALCLMNMLNKEPGVEIGFTGEGIYDIAVKVDGHQPAAVVGAQGDLSARVGREGFESLVGIAVGNGFAENGIPEKNSRFSRFPCIMNNFVPEIASTDGSGYCRLL